jgi:hypothetical protein
MKFATLLLSNVLNKLQKWPLPKMKVASLTVTHSSVKRCKQIRFFRNKKHEWYKLQIFFASVREVNGDLAAG